jgi:hypothetical protein
MTSKRILRALFFQSSPLPAPARKIIPTPYTDPAIVEFLLHYGDLYLGKTTVLAKVHSRIHCKSNWGVWNYGDFQIG